MTLQQAVMLALQASILLTVFGFGLQATIHDLLLLPEKESKAGGEIAYAFGLMGIVSVLAGTLPTASRHPAIALALAKVNFPDEPYLGATILLYLLVAALLSVPYVSRQRRILVPRPSEAIRGNS